MPECDVDNDNGIRALHNMPLTNMLEATEIIKEL